MQQAELATALGVSTRQLRYDIQRGMPTSSVEDARAWREANVRPRYSEPHQRRQFVDKVFLDDAEAIGYALEAALRRLPAALARAGLDRKQIGQVIDEVLAAHLKALREKGDPDAEAMTQVLREELEGA